MPRFPQWASVDKHCLKQERGKILKQRLKVKVNGIGKKNDHRKYKVLRKKIR